MIVPSRTHRRHSSLLRLLPGPDWLMVASVAGLILSAAAAGAAERDAPPATQATLPATIVNGNFEVGTPGSIPTDWIVPTPQSRGELSSESPYAGRSCAFVTCTDPGAAFCNLMQKLDATPYRGQRIRLSAQIRRTDGSGQAQMWLRVDRPNRVMGFFDNMQDRPILAESWQPAVIQGPVDADAVSLNLGIFITGEGKAWIDDVRIEVLPPAPKAEAPPRALTPRGLANLTAFARLFGYVRHFHPTDEALATDWERFALAGLEHVEAAADPAALSDRLREAFAPIAPSLQVARGDRKLSLARPAGATQWHSWRYRGYSPTPKAYDRVSPYFARVVHETLDGGADDRSGTAPGTVIDLALGDEVHALVPIGTFADAAATLPRGAGAPLSLQRPEGWEPSALDRTTRLADVVLAWNVFQHFYPYFDVADTDWELALREALTSAATDADEAAFHETLERMTARLQDGHCAVRGPGDRKARVRLDWNWVGDELVIVTSPGDSLAPDVRAGDVVQAIDGVPPSELYASLFPRISAATEQWRRWRSLARMGSAPEAGVAPISLLHPDGSLVSALVPVGSDPFPQAGLRRPRNGAELAPGVLYFNLDGAPTESLEIVLPKLAAAAGVVFDLRGYPGSAGADLVPHLADQPLQSADWNVPEFRYPDRQQVTYDTSHWALPPEEPRLTGKLVFLIDGRAISYAESCLGIVEHYHLGELVGSPTAGTNGNVIQVKLPGGYSIPFTGMQVIKQDGSRHHGVGILPTVPCVPTISGIAAGRDEVLERGVQVAAGR